MEIQDIEHGGYLWGIITTLATVIAVMARHMVKANRLHHEEVKEILEENNRELQRRLDRKSID